MDVCFIDIDQTSLRPTYLFIQFVEPLHKVSSFVRVGFLGQFLASLPTQMRRTQDAVQRTAGQVAIQRLFEPESQLFQRPIVAGQAVVDRLAFHDNAYELPDLLEAKKGRRPPV